MSFQPKIDEHLESLGQLNVHDINIPKTIAVVDQLIEYVANNYHHICYTCKKYLMGNEINIYTKTCAKCGKRVKITN
jgi:rRNA maturation endonuclease Nob1